MPRFTGLNGAQFHNKLGGISPVGTGNMELGIVRNGHCLVQLYIFIVYVNVCVCVCVRERERERERERDIIFYDGTLT